VNDSTFDQNYLMNYRNDSSVSNKAGLFYVKTASAVELSSCRFNGYNETIIDKLKNDKGK